MKAFHSIAIPHKDIIEGKLTMDHFAADLWEVYNNRAPEEYQNPIEFFNKTYETSGMKNLFQYVKNRIDGKGGDPVFQLQTPFGGGKTHSLIALFHKIEEWEVNKFVMVGTSLDPKTDTIWGLIEKQLTGNNVEFTNKTSPGKDKLRNLLKEHQPLVLLMDETLQFVTKASGVKVGNSDLGAQTIAFLQELTELVGNLESTSLVITLPSSVLEQYDENAEMLFQQLQKVSGRVEKIYTPVQSSEITNVIRSRLFSRIDENSVKENVDTIIEYFDKENILPVNVEKSEYRQKLQKSYPFLPDVIDCLYHRWGSYPSFQRTRGVLRLLSLIIFSQKNQNKGYMSLSDFDLSQSDIRREFIKHIGDEYESILAADITDPNSSSKMIDKNLPESYVGFNLGRRASTAIFLYSFTGSGVKGSSIIELKRNATFTDIPSSVISEVVDKLKQKLTYLADDGLYFTNKPTIRRLLIQKMENIDERELSEYEFDLLKNNIKSDFFNIYIWPNQVRDIRDDNDLKLVILKKKEVEFINDILKKKGEVPRIYRNTIFFLLPYLPQRNSLHDTIRRIMAYSKIKQDTQVKYSDEQKKKINDNLKNERKKQAPLIREAYRIVIVPQKDDLRELDLGMSTYGFEQSLTDEIKEKLVNDGIIVEQLSPIIISKKYLTDKNFVSTKQLLQSSLNTIGEPRIVKDGLISCINNGVINGNFGLGTLIDNKPQPEYWKESVVVTFNDEEYIIDKKICEEKLSKTKESDVEEDPYIEEDRETINEDEKEPIYQEDTIKELELMFNLPKGKVSDIWSLLNYIYDKFGNINFQLKLTNGEVTESEIENNIIESLRQMNIDFDITRGNTKSKFKGEL